MDEHHLAYEETVFLPNIVWSGKVSTDTLWLLSGPLRESCSFPAPLLSLSLTSQERDYDHDNTGGIRSRLSGRDRGRQERETGCDRPHEVRLRDYRGREATAHIFF